MRPRFPQLHDEAWVRDQYVDQERSTIEMAAELGCTPGNVQIALRRFGIKARGRWSDRWKPKTCERCGVEFIPSGPAAKFCSDECRLGKRVCTNPSCRKEFVSLWQSRAHNNPQGYCSRKCWYQHKRDEGKGGRWKNADGYVLIFIGKGEPGTHPDGRILEHRYVMQEMLGRPLVEGENVHHKNGIKDDNRPENLELWVTHQPKGQRPFEQAHCPTCTCALA